MNFLRRWLFRVGVALTLFAAATVVWAMWSRWQADAALAEAVARTDHEQPGWRLDDLEAARPTVADKDNGALIVEAAAKHLSPSFLDLPPLALNPGWPPPNELPTDNQVDTLALSQESVQKAIVEARKLVRTPMGRFPFDPPPPSHEFHEPPHLRRVAGVVNALVCDAWVRAIDDDGVGAALSCRAALHAARSIGDEPLTLSQARRSQRVAQACDAVERVLGLTELKENDLAALQRDFAREEDRPPLTAIIRFQRAYVHNTFDGLEKGIYSLEDIQGEGGRAWYMQMPLSYYHLTEERRGHALIFALADQSLEAARLPEHEQSNALLNAIRAARRESGTFAIVPQSHLMASVEGTDRTCRRGRAHLRCLLFALAAERYRLRHHDWPATVEKLVLEFLSVVPLDPYNGQPLRYRKFDDGIVVYSIGPDGKDNGGVLDLERRVQGKDIGCRLWNPTQRAREPAPEAPKP
jgi:hypothetical protein